MAKQIVTLPSGPKPLKMWQRQLILTVVPTTAKHIATLSSGQKPSPGNYLNCVFCGQKIGAVQLLPYTADIHPISYRETNKTGKKRRRSIRGTLGQRPQYPIYILQDIVPARTEKNS